MIAPKDFFNELNNQGVKFYTGVPDSLLKDFCAYITGHTSKSDHIISANEGGAISLAIGHYLATQNIPAVYMQNSGLGNTINPLISLADQDVYSVPILLIIGWRGEPGIKDEPQHYKQGLITEDLLNTLKIPFTILSDSIEESKKEIDEIFHQLKTHLRPHALLVRDNTFQAYKLTKDIKTDFEMNREEAIKELAKRIDNDIIVATTGKTSRELFEYRKGLNISHEKDFLTVGGMGHANQIALAIALEKENRTVYCFDGDGAVLMHLGSIGIIGDLKPKNFKHILLNNGSHDSVGGQSTIGFGINFGKIFEGLNYTQTFKVSTIEELDNIFEIFKETEGPVLLEILINKGARTDLGRPTLSPKENKSHFMRYLKN